MRKALAHFFFSAFSVLVLMTVPAPVNASSDTAYDRSTAVILAYQRIGEDLYPATNLSTEQFSEHIQELVDGEYHIAPLGDIVTALRNGDKLPDRTVAITFDGAYQSVLQNAIPILRQKNIPFTVFFSPDQADGGSPDYMNWDSIKRLARDNLVTIGLHPADYTRLSTAAPEEISRQINTALSRYRQQLGTEPALFAYPFGEYSREYRDIIASTGLKAAFGQQSGAAWSGSDPHGLPRFTMTESYGDDERFKMAAESLPLPVSDITPDNPRIMADKNPPEFGFSVDESLSEKLGQLSCFISEQGKPEMQVVGKNRVEMRVTKAFEDDRVRVNCTLPGPKPKPGEDQRWRWFGMLLTIGHADEISDDLENHYAPSAGD
jgi:peptidoglycan/xylan/chitin deacetylase (PgdA/CDA1 family)